MDTDKSNSTESGYKPRFLSEYSMGQLDFIRFNEWLKFIETWSAAINSTTEPTLEMVQHLFSGLVNLYDNWRPIIAIKPTTDKLDTKIEKAKKIKRIWENNAKTGMPTSLKIKRDIIDLLGEIKRELMNIKQVIGLGILLKKNMSTKEKIKVGMQKGMGTSQSFPEP